LIGGCEKSINYLNFFYALFWNRHPPTHRPLKNDDDDDETRTAVTLQFVSHSFLDYHDPTIGE